MSTSARLNSPSEGALRRDGIPLDEVIDRISAPAKITLAFIDACRNDPFHRGVGDRGFAPADSSFDRQVYIGMSTKLGKTALDGEKGTGSPFAQSFTRIIPTPGACASMTRSASFAKTSRNEPTAKRSPKSCKTN